MSMLLNKCGTGSFPAFNVASQYGPNAVWKPSDSLVESGSRDFDGSADLFTAASNSTTETGDVSFWISAWCVADTATANMTIVGKWSVTPGREYLLRWNINDTDFFDFFVRDSGDTANTNVSSASGLSTGTKYHLLAYHDAGANEIGLAVNGGTFVTASFSGGVNIAGEDFQIGAADGASLFDGRISNVAFGKPPSTPTWADLRDALYNNGQLLEWDEITSAQRTDWGLTPGNGVFYPLNEESGNALDAVNGLDLTDTNTVGIGASLRSKVLDWSSNKYHGTPVTVSLADLYDSSVPSSPISDWSFNCTGANGINFGDVLDKTGTTAYSLECKVYVNQILAVGQIMISKDGNNDNSWQFLVLGTPSSGKIRHRIKDGTGSDNIEIISTAGIPTGQWMHLLLTYDGSASHTGFTLYIDGVEDTTATKQTNGAFGTSSANSNDLVIGDWDYATAYRPLDGNIAFARIYGSELTAADAADLALGNSIATSAELDVDFREGPGAGYADGDVILAVPDAADGNELEQATAANRPAIDSSSYTKPVWTFDGTNDELNSSIDVTSWTAITVLQWIRPTADPGYRSFSLLHSNNDDIGIYYDTPSDITVRVDDGTAYSTSYGPLALNTWAHVALVFNGSTLYAYRDGVEISSISASFNFATADGTVAVGNLSSATANAWTGNIGITAIYDSALTQKQIQKIMKDTDPQ